MRFLLATILLFLSCSANAKIVGVLADSIQVDEDFCDGCGVSGEIVGLQDIYANAVQNSCKKHGIAVVLIPANMEAIKAFGDSIDGIVVPDYRGNIDPKLYGEHQVSHRSNITNDPKKISFDMNIIKVFAEADKPILAINKGMHLLNVIYGGTLMQKIPKSAVAHELSRDDTHDVILADETKLRKLVFYDEEDLSIPVNSSHTQAVQIFGSDIVPSARARDGIVEAIEVKGRQFVIGVQWDPQYLSSEHDVRIFDSFCEAVKKYRPNNNRN